MKRMSEWTLVKVFSFLYGYIHKPDVIVTADFNSDLQGNL